MYWAGFLRERRDVAGCQMMGENSHVHELTQTMEVGKERSREGEKKGGVLFNNNLFINEGREAKVGQDAGAQQELGGLGKNGLEEMIKRMDGLMSVLRARNERLIKTQAKYWVELAEEEEDENKNSGAIIPFQNTEVRKLEKELRDWSLKRKAEEKPESPPYKRRKDYRQDSPKSSGDQGKAEMELRRIEFKEGSDPFGFRYEGNLIFVKGNNYRGRRGECRRIKKALFLEQNCKLNTGLMLKKERREELMEEDEEREYEDNLERCGGWPSTGWNCQGLGTTLTVRNLKFQCRRFSSKIVFLSETKMKGTKIEKIRKKMKYDHGEYFEPVGKSGGLTVWWKEDVQLKIGYISRFIIHLVDICVEGRQWGNMTLVYSPVDMNRKNQ